MKLELLLQLDGAASRVNSSYSHFEAVFQFNYVQSVSQFYVVSHDDKVLMVNEKLVVRMIR
jgi:hypothetical protein